MGYEKSLEKVLSDASMILKNAVRPEILSELTLYGYALEKIAVGNNLYDTALELYNLQKKEYGDQFSATDALEKAQLTANKKYIKHVKLARLAFTDNRGVWQELGLSGRRKKSISGWIAQATLFYKNSINNETILNGLSEFGITIEDLTTGQNLVNAVVDADAHQEHEKSEAQQATLKRDDALDELDEWISKFINVAKIAYEDDPQVLESLGIVVH